MVKRFLKRPSCPTVPQGYNNGQAVQWVLGYELTGKPMACDNVKGSLQADCDGWQIKSPRCTVNDDDFCKGYLFGFHDESYYYELTKAEMLELEKFFVKVSASSQGSKRKELTKRLEGGPSIKLFLAYKENNPVSVAKVLRKHSRIKQETRDNVKKWAMGL